ncbi:aldo/keto reductase [Gloeocapsopsis crepidinum]|uniref:aldo/keto reductase n=1 Tax=Gloeocapsopsis crepidinum TaxID=693223 RepID=UPI001D13BE7A|nr:aldo/keto reductase [Gloeocapsopsis crepidinum]
MSRTQSDWQDLEIFQVHNIAPQELVVESLLSHLIVIHTTPQPVEVIEQADSLRFKGLAQAGSLNIHSAVNWTANQPGIGSVIVGATKLSQLEDNLKALDFEIPTELSDRLDAISCPEPQFPYSFFEPEIQGMIHGGKSVGLKPKGYYPILQ